MNDRRRRHQRTIATLIVTAAATYGSYRLAHWYFGAEDDEDKHGATVDSFTEQLQSHGDRAPPASHIPTGQEQNSAAQRPPQLGLRMRSAQMALCREHVTRALPSFCQQLRQAIERQTDISEETRQLRGLPAHSDDPKCRTDMERQQTQLWEQIKVKSVTQAIATAYAHVILYLALTVSTHVAFGRQIGRYKYNDDSSTAPEIHRFVLHHILSPFLHSGVDPTDSGLHRLVVAVQDAVTKRMADWNVRDPAYLEIKPVQMEGVLDAVWECLCQRGHADNNGIGLVRFLFSTPTTTTAKPTKTHAQVSTLDERHCELYSAQLLLDETLDVLESPVSRDAERDCVKACMRHFQAKVFDTQTLPLATVLTRLRKVTKTCYGFGATTENQNEYVAVMEASPAMTELRDVSFTYW